MTVGSRTLLQHFHLVFTFISIATNYGELVTREKKIIISCKISAVENGFQRTI